MLSLKLKKSILFQLIIILVYVFQLILFLFDDITEQQVTILQYELVVYYVFALAFSYRKYGAFSLYSLFLYTMFIFVYARIFLDITGLTKWYWANKWMDFYFPLNTQYEILNLLLVSLLFIHLGFLLAEKRITKKMPIVAPNERLEKISLFFFCCAIPGTFTKYLIELKTILTQGYLALFDGTLSTISYPFWTAGSGTLLISSYATFLASRPTKKKFWIISIIFFSICTLNMIKGSRSKLFVPFLFLLWYYNEFYLTKKIHFYKIFLIVGISIVISQLMLFNRDSGLTVDISTLWSLFFMQQGVSLLVLGYMVYFKSSFINHGLPYIFSPLLFWESGYGQTAETINLTHRLAYKLTYFISSEAFLKGEGLGASFLGEFYDLGYVAFVLMSCLLGYIIFSFTKYSKTHRPLLALSLVVVQTIVYMPRNTFLPLLEEILSVILFYYLAIYLANRNFKFVYGKRTTCITR